MLICWKKELEIGNEMIDTQHRMLVLLLRKLHIAVVNKLEHKVIMGILLEIKKFTEFHFLSEENLMAELHYPELRQHEKIHSELLSQLNIFIAKINRQLESPEDILEVIHTWVANHVVSEDMKIAQFVRESQFRPIAEDCYALYLR
ncbi:Bacteriohemerythrin [Ferriphaselus amnicola]|uniref:Bacteriohemerythrin n=1 Tax=Ferriphaselus amnicola TaxID=1188319 RepID=A0A2Z6GDT5_9PROT|nr:bacteriohemerythrin [Ferriphaselus amnicola]BBE51706.1 Bacteriohemerythrin [Ferriphaselus amnicola]